MAKFEIAYKKTNRNEGGWNHTPGDNGGETYCGIARKFWPQWAGWKIVDENKPLKKGEVINNMQLENLKKQFYKVNFWDKIGGDEIEFQDTADTLYDFGVNANYPPSIKNIQKALGLTQSGKITAKLIEAINNPVKYLVMILMVFSLFSCKPNVDSMPVKKTDTVYVTKNIIKTDTVFIENKSDLVLKNKYDSLNAINKNLGSQLLQKKLIIENAKYYLNIANKKPSQVKFLRGWMNRALSQ